jgi:hypothetical protein
MSDQMLAQLLRQISPTDGTVIAIPQAAKIIRQAASALESRSPSRRSILEEAAKVAERGCLTQPDGGSPTEPERELCEAIAAAIRSLTQPENAG